jgi:hypothetical protein
MSSENLIPISKLLDQYSIEPAFVDFLGEMHIISLIVVKEEKFMDESEIPGLERMMRLHYDLGINYEGLDAISHLLERMSAMEREIRALRNRLG